jgi:hypothetical protein
MKINKNTPFKGAFLFGNWRRDFI